MLPGAFDTDRLKSNMERDRAKKAGSASTMRAKSGSPWFRRSRFGEAPEFGEACAFLCSAQAGYITGQNLLIDGGAYPGTF